MIVVAGLGALWFGFSVGTLIAHRWKGRAGEPQVVNALAEEHARFVVGMLLSLQAIEDAEDPATEARHTREMIQMTIQGS